MKEIFKEKKWRLCALFGQKDEMVKQKQQKTFELYESGEALGERFKQNKVLTSRKNKFRLILKIMSCMNCEAKITEDQIELNDCSDFWVIGVDILEAEANFLNVPIRPGSHGIQYVWVGDINPD